ncbi:tRNA (mo5U34)-methyltransferase [Thiorhodovibrio winogradskyi]|uniref:tRNA U34 carboxymethyltransferase n=1 Tax=Thiorhodovibrio winogradskyi TaxID=77007 RepID=A0ABZ0S6E1_9GAMM|nr:tRNA 5-methoxyuridine(34)/uridine 5-oxyacetic acid(34) synthase CmoB [Thiorhodovibrio winogradskyi]
MVQSVAQIISAPFAPFFAHWQQSGAAAWLPRLRALTQARLQAPRHGDWARWMSLLARLPDIQAHERSFAQPCVGVTSAQPLDAPAHGELRAALMGLHPWRKGPFCLHGVMIDAEWRSDWKWARAAQALGDLDNAMVLDLGCGNGYYGYRALGAGARLVLGIDPGLRFVAQFLAVNHFLRSDRLAVLPLADEDLADQAASVDLLLSMGVLYHRRDPLRHLKILRPLLQSGGRLLLETLVLDVSGDALLEPTGRYAQMRNVYAIPSMTRLQAWLRAAGFRQIELVDLTVTTSAEQRGTDWMRFQSLADFLDPTDLGRTCEGYPAPVRAMLIAQRG